MNHGDITTFFLAVAILLGLARILGELCQRFGQPAVLGEIFAGLILGVTVFGRFAPEWQVTLFPNSGAVFIAMKGLSTLALTLFLLVAGLEIDFKGIARQGRAAISVSFFGMIIPFAIGFLSAWYAPSLLGSRADAQNLPFALFMATALSISALPVIAKTLMDLGLYRTDFGVVVMAAALVNDLLGWLVFALILGMIGQGGHGLSFGATVGATLAFSLFMVTVGRRSFDRILPWVQANTTWPGGVLGLAFTSALLGAALTEWIGIHAVFGAFLVGIALGDSKHLQPRTRATIEQFVSFVFAPLFFASIGLHVDFVANFNLRLCLSVLIIATIGKLIGSMIGSRLGGFSRRESLAIGFGMNARGAMEIVLGLLALEVGLISERLFVAIVIMALATSLISGPIMQRILRRKRPIKFHDFLSDATYGGHLLATNRFEAINELSAAAAQVANLDANLVAQAVWEREQVMPTGLNNRVAVPYARVPGLTRPLVALGFSRAAIDFEAPDGQTAQIIALVLFPEGGTDEQWAIIGDVARTFANPEVRERALRVATFTELRALFKVASDPGETTLHGEAQRPRNGYVLVGARPVARELAKLLGESGTPAWLVDTNRNTYELAHAQGLSVVLGNALRDVTLLKAHAFEAEGILALTPNAQANEEVIYFARREFAIPEGRAAGADPGTLSGARAASITDLGVLDRWDGLLAAGRVETLRLVVDENTALEQSVLSALAGGRDVLALVIERQGHGEVAERGMELKKGDVLSVLAIKDQATPDAWMLDMIGRAPVMDFETAVSAEDFFVRVSDVLAGRLHLDPQDLAQKFIEHEMFQPTILTATLAAPHLLIGGQGIIELVLCRSRNGIRLSTRTEPVELAIVLVTSRDERPRYLQFLAALAEVAQKPGTLKNWCDASDGERFRAAIRAAFTRRGA